MALIGISFTLTFIGLGLVFILNLWSPIPRHVSEIDRLRRFLGGELPQSHSEGRVKFISYQRPECWFRVSMIGLNPIKSLFRKSGQQETLSVNGKPPDRFNQSAVSWTRWNILMGSRTPERLKARLVQSSGVDRANWRQLLHTALRINGVGGLIILRWFTSMLSLSPIYESRFQEGTWERRGRG